MKLKIRETNFYELHSVQKIDCSNHLPLTFLGHISKVPQCDSVLKLLEKTSTPHLTAPPPQPHFTIKHGRVSKLKAGQES